MTRQVLGIDVGGSSIKAGLVDVDAGRLTGGLISAPTPRPSTPAAMMPVIAALAAQARRRERQRRHRLPERHQAGHGAHRGQRRSHLDRHRRRGAGGPCARPAGAVSQRRRRGRRRRDALGRRARQQRGGHHAHPRHRHRHRAVRRRQAVPEHRARAPGAARHGRGEVGLGPGAHGRAARLSRMDRAGERVSRAPARSCSGRTCSSSAAR